jgi:ADP-heptose:LPS heptosyltransferase
LSPISNLSISHRETSDIVSGGFVQGQAGIAFEPLVGRANTRILVVRACAIGDFVLNIPALLGLRHHLGASVRFTFVGYSSTLQITREFLPADAIEAIQSIETPPWSALFAGPIERTGFDAAIVWMKDDTVARNLQKSGINYVIHANPFPGSGHVADHLLRTLNLPAPPLPDTWLPSSERLILHPGSGSRAKCWPHFSRLMDALQRISIPAVFMLGPNEHGFETTRPCMKGLTLLEAARELRACRGYIGNDSGITHLAALLGTPVLALFGPTDPAVWGPWGRRVRILRKPGLDAISVEEVLEYAEWLSTNLPT